MSPLAIMITILGGVGFVVLTGAMTYRYCYDMTSMTKFDSQVLAIFALFLAPLFFLPIITLYLARWKERKPSNRRQARDAHKYAQ